MAREQTLERGAAVLDAAAERAKTKKPKFPRTWLDDAAPQLSGNYLIKGVIDHGLIVIYGPPGEGKTFFTEDISGHVAVGMSWRGRRVRRGLVVYVAAEAGASILRRFYAWREHHVGEAREERIPLTIITRSINLLNLVEVEALLVELRTIAAESGMPLALVVFDTLSRCMPGGDENSAEDLTRVIAAADLIRDELGAATAIVHHSGKDAGRGARGHSSLCAAADTVIAVIKRVATIEKSRDGVAGESFAFDLDVVNVGTDDDGDSVTTCIVVPTETQQRHTTPKKFSGVSHIALAALREAVADHGQTMGESTTIPRGVRAVTLERWRAQFRIRYGTDHEGRDRDHEAIRKAFNRAREQLAEVVGVSDPFVWLWW